MAYSIYDARIKSYSDARIWEYLVRESSNRPMSAERKERHDEIKRALRRFYHRDRSGRRLVSSNDIDSYTLLVTCPEWVKTEEDAEEWFEEEERMECIPSLYDCTGQHFSCGHKVFQRNGKWMCYHHIAVDI